MKIRDPTSLRHPVSCHTCDFLEKHARTPANVAYFLEFVMAQVCTVRHMNESCCTYEWVISHIRMRHGNRIYNIAHMNKSWHSCDFHQQQGRTAAMIARILERVTAHICTVTHANKSWHTYEWAMAHVRLSWSTSENACKCSPHIWMRHGTWMYCHTYK